MAEHKRGFVYRSYNFVDKDPVLDVARTVVQQSGLSLAEVHEAGGPTSGTLNRWFNKEARTCRFDSLAATLRACSADLVVRMTDGEEIVVGPKSPKTPRKSKR